MSLHSWKKDGYYLMVCTKCGLMKRTGQRTVFVTANKKEIKAVEYITKDGEIIEGKAPKCIQVYIEKSLTLF